ncbi:MAG TPA: hypothetical protein VD816_01365 [Ohtaekwangia sp.]|nr:hypothetical protein [Ohtaekwangia sp.]
MSKSKKSTAKEAAPEEEKFPGYPQYSDKEDITFQNDRVSMNEEGVAMEEESLARKPDPDDDNIIKPSNRRSPSDVTKEDLEALGPENLSMDMGEDEELLKHRVQPVDFAGEDLDVPGAELDDDSESLGTEDEENNSYSLGSDRHEDLDEGHSLK